MLNMHLNRCFGAPESLLLIWCQMQRWQKTSVLTVGKDWEWWMGRRLRSERAGMGMMTKWAGVRERTGRLALRGTLGEPVLFTYHCLDCIFIQGRSLWFTPKDTSLYRCECRAGECAASSIWLLQGNIFMELLLMPIQSSWIPHLMSPTYLL